MSDEAWELVGVSSKRLRIEVDTKKMAVVSQFVVFRLREIYILSQARHFTLPLTDNANGLSLSVNSLSLMNEYIHVESPTELV